MGLGAVNYAQIHDPVKWTTSVEKISDTEYDLIINASIESNWHLYSQNVPEDGPIPTSFAFESSEDFELVGSVSEEEGHTVDDPVFEMKIKYFENKATFKQRVKLLNEKASTIIGEVEFMVCDDASCLPPTFVDLKFSILKNNTVAENPSKADSNQVLTSGEKQKKSKSPSKSLLGIFFIAFLSGFAALLTPCVFPMIPMTVSFFTKQSKNKAAGIKNAIIYGLSIVIIYVLLGSLVSAVFGADALNALSTNVWFNIIFFLLLIVFAVSFLGAFEIVLPSSWGTKVDSQADRGGIIGIFFMALALAIVSFSCTGPIVGTLLVQAAAGGNQIGPIVGMLGFSLALAIPFALFAAFPGWLNSLPKSGGWLNTVKVVLGFLELALAFKFLSNADLVLQLHWLEREVFLSIWIAIFGVLAMYLFGKIQLPHDSPLTHISVGRLSLGMVSLMFTIYMIP
ncbi:MAG: thiol:disulfide interchange protein, partial [Bacteroidetes bacterium]|nr:thiol:disulfide interchange protein [Bacteroidota bacterium]